MGKNDKAIKQISALFFFKKKQQQQQNKMTTTKNNNGMLYGKHKYTGGGDALK